MFALSGNGVRHYRSLYDAPLGLVEACPTGRIHSLLLCDSIRCAGAILHS